MSIHNRVRYCDRCGESLRGKGYWSAAGLDFHLDGCPKPDDNLPDPPAHNNQDVE